MSLAGTEPKTWSHCGPDLCSPEETGVWSEAPPTGLYVSDKLILRSLKCTVVYALGLRRPRLFLKGVIQVLKTRGKCLVSFIAVSQTHWVLDSAQAALLFLFNDSVRNLYEY